MQVPSLNLGAWLDRLGVKRPGWAPEVAETIVPVMIVADRSAHVSKLRQPIGFAQAYVDPANLSGPPPRFAGVLVQCRANGGADIWLSMSQAVGDPSGIPAQSAFPYASFAFTDAVPSMTVVTTPTIEQPDPAFPVLSLIQACRSTAGVPVQTAKNGRPLIFGGLNATEAGPPAFLVNDSHDSRYLTCWLPPGRVLYAEAYTPGIDTVFNVFVREYPAPA